MKHIPEDCEAGYRYTYPLIEAKYQYEFLFELDTNDLKRITGIIFLYSGVLEVNFYKDMFTKYSANVEAYRSEAYYKFILENRTFPDKDKINDIGKKGLIEDLIQKQVFLNYDDTDSSSFSGGDFITCIDHNTELLINFIDRFHDSVIINLYTRPHVMKLQNKPAIIKIDTSSFLNVDKELKKLREVVQISPELDEYYFTPPLPYPLLKERFLSDLGNYPSRKTAHCQLVGNDFYLVYIAVEIILGSQDYDEEDLTNGIPNDIENAKIILLKNLQVLERRAELKTLHDFVQGISRVILHTSRYRDLSLFTKFHRHDLPSREKLTRSITELFIAMLLDAERFEETHPNAFIHFQSMIRGNVFEKLLDGFETLDDLRAVIKEFDRIPNSELYSSPFLWYHIKNRLDELKKERRDKLPAYNRRVIIEFRNDGWHYKGINGITPSDSFTIIGCYAAAVLIHMHNNGYIGLRYDPLKELSCILAEKSGKKVSKNNSGEPREALVKNFDDFKKRHPSFADFYQLHIEVKEKQYWFKPRDGVEYIVKHPALNEEFLEFYRTITQKKV